MTRFFRIFEEEELEDPWPRKVLEGRTIYTSRILPLKGYGFPVLFDFGSAVNRDVEHLDDVQPNIYRSSEVILKVPWRYSIDIWNVDCMESLMLGGGNQAPRHRVTQVWGFVRRWPPIHWSGSGTSNP